MLQGFAGRGQGGMSFDHGAICGKKRRPSAFETRCVDGSKTIKTFERFNAIVRCQGRGTEVLRNEQSPLGIQLLLVA